ncbi:hypothetical protein [Rhodococcoides fascians]|uniref:hypothetical protein n=1 Tax=Rhodococcoides fascians TaxID=1828 RepID=UPI00050C017E|nr:hypothetical protein [Rhodococcus fascians]
MERYIYRGDATATPAPSLMVRANFGELTLGNYAPFQVDVRSLIVAFVRFDVLTEFRDNWADREEIENTIQVSASISANPWIEIFNAANLATVSAGSIVSTAILNAGKLMDVCARIGTVGLERRAKRTGYEKEIAENERDTIKARFESKRFAQDEFMLPHAQAAESAIDAFESYDVTPQDFGVRLISRADTTRIQSRVVDLASDAVWSTSENARAFDNARLF